MSGRWDTAQPKGGIELQDEDDEETLQLKLNAIEARLRLKKLQKQQSPDATPSVHVPVSPKRRSALLPLYSASNNGSQPASRGIERPAKKAVTAQHRAKAIPSDPPRPAHERQSFNQRLADVRSKDQSAGERRKATQRKQSTGFAMTRSATDVPGGPAKADLCDSSDRDINSGFYLSRRFLATHDLQGVFDDKAIYKLPRLLKEVTSPSYNPPETDGDFVVFGIVASKSNPILHSKGETRPTEPPSDKGQPKFMVLHLTDLEWEIDLYLFGSGFDSFWKLSVGSVLAILNPGIMPPKRHMRDSGQFSLKLSSSNDAVLEIGTAAHLGFCKSVKKDGNECGAWFDNRKADHCDFHISLAVERSRSGRMETNTMSSFSLFGGPNAGRGSEGRGRGNRRGRGGAAAAHVRDWRNSPRSGPLKSNGMYRDYEAHSSAYSIPPELRKGASAAQLLDAQENTHFAGTSAGERRQKRMAALERDRHLAGALSKNARQSTATDDDKDRATHSSSLDRTQDADAPSDAKSLGLIGRTGPRLTASKRNGAAAVGWSAAYKRGLPEASQPGPSPKKARFDLAGKGLREPDKESREDLRNRRPQLVDDDDLDVV